MRVEVEESTGCDIAVSECGQSALFAWTPGSQ